MPIFTVLKQLFTVEQYVLCIHAQSSNKQCRS